jgi:peptidoglycan/LPS O-acetylase OafA/YrhL
MNQGVYPFYIIHMPITFAALKLSTEMGITNYSAVLLSCLLVTLGCWFSFEILKRTKVSRYLFGIKEIPIKKLD